MKKIIIILTLILGVLQSQSQSVSLNTNGGAADNSAMLDISSVNKGLLIPRLSLASYSDAVSISSPATSLLIYNTNPLLGVGYFYNSGTAVAPSWVRLQAANSSDWLMAGNFASATDFIGTTNNQSLRLRVNNSTAGEINPINNNTSFGQYNLFANTTGTKNTAIGYSSLYHNTTGLENTSVGYGSLLANTTGGGNTAIGVNALNFNGTGGSNTAVGWGALYANSTGNSNTAIGYKALTNTTSSFNCAIGNLALQDNSSGGHNNAMGDDALINNTTGNNNNAIGAFTLFFNTTGTSNTAIGDGPLGDNTSGNNNVGIGTDALTSNTTGSDNIALGSGALSLNSIGGNMVAIGDSALFNENSTLFYGNTAIGSKALFSNSDGAFNTATGIQALYNNLEAYHNSAFGTAAAFHTTTGSGNTAIGDGTLQNNYTGANNTALGFISGVTQTNLNKTTAIGYNALVGASNCMALGGTGADQVKVAIGLQIPLTDLHIKQTNENYPINGGGIRMERLANTNHWDLGVDYGDDFDFVWNGVSKAYLNNITGAYTTVSDIRVKKDIHPVELIIPNVMKLQAITYHYKDNPAGAQFSYGFIAQEVEKIFPDFVKTKGKDDMKAIAYENFSVVAIKAIQEQQHVIEELLKRVQILEDKTTATQK